MTILYRFNNRFARINGRYAGTSGHGPSPDPFPTVQIGNQIWSAGIVDIDDGGSGIDTFDLSYQGYSSLGMVKYYTYDAALRIANSVQGWHLPTKAEVDTLVNYVGGGYNSTTAFKLKSTDVWSNPGTNDYGFNALPYGMVDLYSGDIYNVGTESTFWQVDSYRMYILNDDSISNGTEAGGYKYPLRLIKDQADPYNPLNLPPYTIRVAFEPGYDPSVNLAGTWTQVSSSPNVWDGTKSDGDWNNWFNNYSFASNKYLECLGMNSAGVTNMERLFNCSWGMTGDIPAMNTQSLYDASYIFYECRGITGNIYNTYLQMATQATPPGLHPGVFRETGQNTSAASELAQIPSDWGGTAN